MLLQRKAQTEGGAPLRPHSKSVVEQAWVPGLPLPTPVLAPWLWGGPKGEETLSPNPTLIHPAFHSWVHSRDTHLRGQPGPGLGGQKRSLGLLR